MLRPISSRRMAFLCIFVLIFCALSIPVPSWGESTEEDVPEEFIYPDIFLELRPGSVYSPGLDGIISWMRRFP